MAHVPAPRDSQEGRQGSPLSMRSVRVGRRIIQQTVAHLDERGRVEAWALARRLIGNPEQAQLFDDGSEHLTVPVRLKGIRVERARQFGDVDLALALWRGTGLEALCERLLPTDHMNTLHFDGGSQKKATFHHASPFGNDRRPMEMPTRDHAGWISDFAMWLLAPTD
jgi:hypothetical protein